VGEKKLRTVKEVQGRENQSEGFSSVGQKKGRLKIQANSKAFPGERVHALLAMNQAGGKVGNGKKFPSWERLLKIANKQPWGAVCIPFGGKKECSEKKQAPGSFFEGKKGKKIGH